MIRRLWVWSLAGLITVGVMVANSVSRAAGGPVRAHEALVQQCPESQYSSTRDPSNPLELPNPPGADPLTGAHFFVDGPAHGAAAGAIAQLLGLDPSSYPDSYSWAQFQQDLTPGGSLYPQLQSNPTLAHQVALLEEIADQEETQNLSLYSMGGGPGAIFDQVQKIVCRNITADPTPNTVPVFSTFLIYPDGKFCPSLSEIQNNQSTFHRQVDEMAEGIDDRPALFFLEIDAVGTSTCLDSSELAAWEADLRFEIEALTALHHTVVYVEGGAANEDSPRYIAHVLSGVCVVNKRFVCQGLRGFYVNGTHFDWTLNEIHWANLVVSYLRSQISSETGISYTAHLARAPATRGKR